VIAGCRGEAPPSLARALAARGDARTLARGYLEVTMNGRAEERPRAALLWGLYACEATSPLSALRAFSFAAPAGGRARLAARRLEEALTASPPDASLWLAASSAAWLAPEVRARFRIRGAELLAAQGSADEAVRALPPLESVPVTERGRALTLLASIPAGGAAAKRRLAIEYPQQFAATFPAADGALLEKSFEPADWGRLAAALLDAGNADDALRAARRAGPVAALTAARAALRLRHPSEALAWADRLDRTSVDGALERAEALRQLAWIAAGDARRVAFGRLVLAAENARRLTTEAGPAASRADLLLAEALTELGRSSDAAVVAARGFDRSLPRWEWVWRRLVFQQAQHQGETPPSSTPDPPVSTRVQRTTAFWRARRLARGGDTAPLRELATSGFPDLPALWAAQELREDGVSVTLTAAAPPAPAPPEWAGDLLALGRVSDVVVAWRAELEAGGGGTPAWLGLVRLADMPPLDAIPLLVRGEPRLLSGPWNALPRELLERYLPLPWRPELESAARRSGVPPWLLAGLARHESAWNPRARSVAGAVGLVQVLPATAMEKGPALGLRLKSNAEIVEPATNLLLGASLLADWRHSFGGSWTAGLAAYDGGERRVRETWERAGSHDGPAFVEALEVPETWDYVHRVVLLAEGYRLLYWPEGRPYPWT
jgi:soluble lytic murein transglycosylase-like protein